MVKVILRPIIQFACFIKVWLRKAGEGERKREGAWSFGGGGGGAHRHQLFHLDESLNTAMESLSILLQYTGCCLQKIKNKKKMYSLQAQLFKFFKSVK